MANRNSRRTAILVAALGLLGGSAFASSEANPDFGDLAAPATTGSLGLEQVSGAALIPALGADYRTLQLLGALETVETAVAAGEYIPSEAQEALDEHAMRWRKAYQDELGEGEQSPGFDDLFEATLGEQQAPSKVGAYEEVARRLEALYFATTRYHMALSLRRSGMSGYRTFTPRAEGTVGLSAEEYQQVSQGYAPQLQQGITRTTQELRALLQKS